MTTLEQILADLDAAEAKCREARKAIVLGDREAAVHCTRRIEFNALNATLLIRTFSDQAFPAATEHLRCGPHRPLGCSVTVGSSVTLAPPAQGISSHPSDQSDQSEEICSCPACLSVTRAQAPSPTASPARTEGWGEGEQYPSLLVDQCPMRIE